MNIGEWLKDIGMEQYLSAFESNHLSLDNLDSVTEADLESIGIPLGHRKTILKEIQRRESGRALAEDGAQRQMAEKRVCKVVARTQNFSMLVGGVLMALYCAFDPEMAGSMPISGIWGEVLFGVMGFIGGAIVGVIFWLPIYLYMLPTVFAFKRQNKFRWAIAIANVFLGVTLIGWVILLFLGLKKIDGTQAVVLAAFSDSTA
jgi:hypothetical protein